MRTPNPEIKAYVEHEIIPRYRSFDAAHGTDHVQTVIAESLQLAQRYDADPDMVYVVAAFHDTGLCNGREHHHTDSARILAADAFIRSRFTEQQIALMCEAVEDHRASSAHEPRSLYGRIVAEADRLIDPETTLRRTVQYGLTHSPEADREGHFRRMCSHMQEKYAEGGYLKLWCPESGNAARLAELRRIIADKAELRRRFDALYDSLTAEQ